MTTNRRILAVNLVFVAVLVLIGVLSWGNALLTTGPWYDANISIILYGISLPLAVVLAVVIAVTTARWVAHLEEALRSLDTRIAVVRAAPSPDPSAVVPDAVSPALEQTLQTLDRSPAAEVAREMGSDVLIEVTGTLSPRAAQARLETMAELVSQRLQLRRSRRRAWWTVAGPMVMSFAFAAISGAMLPGAGGFAQTYFRLNTTLVLFLAYTWWILVAWAVVSFQFLHAATAGLPSDWRSRISEAP